MAVSPRFKFTVPLLDTSVLAWVRQQSDLSASIRAIIRETIERHGMVDVVFRPVVQLPRRGRPVGSGTSASGQVTEEGVLAEVQELAESGAGGYVSDDEVASVAAPEVEAAEIEVADEVSDDQSTPSMDDLFNHR